MLDSKKEILSNIIIGESRSHENLTVHSLRFGGDPGPDYGPLASLLDQGEVVITEVDEGGHVPNLAVANKSATAVLILDGEELHGAKQNRVLNTSILVAAGAELTVPVSCTEQGRWAYSTREFRSSPNLMRHDVRSRKVESVSDSLRAGRGYSSDQGEVWNSIQMMQYEAGIVSPTAAMSDTYTSMGADLEAFAEAIIREEGQAGMMVFIDGRPAGLDLVSRPEVYSQLHEKILRSYALDAALRQRKSREEREAVPEDEGPQGEVVADFMAAMAQCDAEKFPSAGLGEDVRFQGPDVIGTALEVDGSIVHAAFFPKPRVEPAEPREQMLKSTRRASNLWGIIHDD